MTRSAKEKVLIATVAVPGTAVQFSTTPIYTPDFEIYIDSGAGSFVYIGDSTVDNTWIPHSAGQDFGKTSGNGSIVDTNNMFDLSKWYVDADTAGDKVIIQYRIFED